MCATDNWLLSLVSLMSSSCMINITINLHVHFIWPTRRAIVDRRNGFQDVHKEIIRGQRAASEQWKNTCRKLVLAGAPCHLAARKSCSFLTSFVLSIRLLCSRLPTDDRWSEGDRARSTRPDIIAPLLIDFCRVAFCVEALPPTYISVSPQRTLHFYCSLM